MKVWVYVEGPSDCFALGALWARWRAELKGAGWGLEVIALHDKSRYLRKIGHRAAEKLCGSNEDLAVGLPDLYPNREYRTTDYKHANIAELRQLQVRLVTRELEGVFGLTHVQSSEALDRFFGTAFKHDSEMLLLAASDQLRAYLGTRDRLGNWRHPVEDQDQNTPPKRIIEELFRVKKRASYRDTVHARAILDEVDAVKDILYSDAGLLECPVFKEMMDWIGERTGVRGY